jgi:hypothetical protein
MYLKRLRWETAPGPPVLVGAERGPHAPAISIATYERGLLPGVEKVEVAAAGDRTVSEPRPARQEVRQPAPEKVAAPSGTPLYPAAALLGEGGAQTAA